jgi:hypothetical protein
MACAVCSSVPLSGAAPFLELELELIQTQLVQKKMLRAEVYAFVLRASKPSNMPAWLRAVARGRSPGSCFPQLGPQLYFITGEAVISRFCSSSIMMGCWSAQRNDY